MGNGAKLEWWTPLRLSAAKLASEGKSRADVAKELGIGLRTLGTWYASEQFNFKVQEFCAQTQTAMMKQGICMKANRLEILQKQVDRMVLLLDKRDLDKKILDFDPKLSRELREYLKQAAIEMGEWTEKRELMGEGGGAIKVIIEYSEQLTTQDDQDSDTEAP